MRKDIEIPEVKDVYVAAVLEYKNDFKSEDWYVYLINDGELPLETVLIVSQGYDEKDITSIMRHSVKCIPAKGYARIEFLEQSVLRLNNFFTITYFIQDRLYDKRFELPSKSVKRDNSVALPVMGRKGVLAR